MNTKTRMIVLSAALAVTLAAGWGVASASAIYENHFDFYRAVASAEAARDTSAPVRHRHVAKHRPALSPAAVPVTTNDKLAPGASRGRMSDIGRAD